MSQVIPAQVQNAEAAEAEDSLGKTLEAVLSEDEFFNSELLKLIRDGGEASTVQIEIAEILQLADVVGEWSIEGGAEGEELGVVFVGFGEAVQEGSLWVGVVVCSDGSGFGYNGDGARGDLGLWFGLVGG